MNHQTPSLASPESYFWAATLHDMDKAETNDFSSNTAPRNHPLHGTWTRGSLTPPHSDYIHAPATIAMALPRELVERILLLLDPKSTLQCRVVNRGFDAIIQSSTLVQYRLACAAAGVIDNPKSRLSYAERLEALKKREDAWRKLEPVFETTIKVNDQMSRVYEVTAGNYFLTDKDRRDLYCCHLPSSPRDNPEWFRIISPGQTPPGFIVHIGMAIYEHDLIVNVISSEVGDQTDMQRYSLDLVLLKFSTGEYHPLARYPRIHVQRSPSPRPYSGIIRIAGDNIALVVDYEDGSKLFIFDWKAGHKRLQHKASKDAYVCSVPVFLSPELLLVPNRILSHFEVWHIFPSHINTNPPVHILSLQIPAVSDNYSILRFYCHGELNPFLHFMPYFPLRPFSPSSEDSIITVNIGLGSLPRFQVESAYKLVMQRRALLEVIQKWTPSSLLEQQGLLTCLTNEVTVHEVTDPDDGSVRLVARSESVSTMLNLAYSSSSPISSGSASSTSRYKILQVRWADWGPPISRWFQVSGPPSRTWWATQSTGQRCAFLDPSPRDNRKWLVGVADFNLHNVRRNLEMTAQLRGEGESSGDNGNRKKDDEELEVLNHKGVFSEDVYMGLKCVVSHAPDEYDFDAVLMDEERLLGLKLDGVGVTKSIKVLYFG